MERSEIEMVFVDPISDETEWYPYTIDDDNEAWEDELSDKWERIANKKLKEIIDKQYPNAWVILVAECDWSQEHTIRNTRAFHTVVEYVTDADDWIDEYVEAADYATAVMLEKHPEIAKSDEPKPKSPEQIQAEAEWEEWKAFRREECEAFFGQAKPYPIPLATYIPDPPPAPVEPKEIGECVGFLRTPK